MAPPENESPHCNRSLLFQGHVSPIIPNIKHWAAFLDFQILNDSNLENLKST
jgi:hypothetical protein